MKISKEAKIGLIITSGIALLFWGVNYLKGKDFLTSQLVVFAVYDRVDGLTASNPVQVNGMKIGSVSKLSLLPDHSGRVLVTMHISGKVLIPRNSIAQIFNTDLLGTKGIRFLFGNSTENVVDGDTLTPDIQKSLSQEVSSQVAPLRAKAESMISSMDSVLMIIRTVFNEDTKRNLRRSFESISNSLLSIEHLTKDMDTVLAKQGRLRIIFDNLESISSNLRNNNEHLSNAIENFSAISDTIAQSNLSETLSKTQETLEGTSLLLQRINKGEGTLGQLAVNDSLYRNLNSTSQDLDLLLKDLRENPKRYVNFSVFGKKSK